MPPKFAAGCVECDDRPLCRICGRPRQEGSPNWAPKPGMMHVPEPCQGPEPYLRGLVWRFDNEAALAAWEAAHAPLSDPSMPDNARHMNSWSLRVK